MSSEREGEGEGGETEAEKNGQRYLQAVQRWSPTEDKPEDARRGAMSIVCQYIYLQRKGWKKSKLIKFTCFLLLFLRQFCTVKNILSPMMFEHEERKHLETALWEVTYQESRELVVSPCDCHERY